MNGNQNFYNIAKKVTDWQHLQHGWNRWILNQRNWQRLVFFMKEFQTHAGVFIVELLLITGKLMMILFKNISSIQGDVILWNTLCKQTILTSDWLNVYHLSFSVHKHEIYIYIPEEFCNYIISYLTINNITLIGADMEITHIQISSRTSLEIDFR